MHFDDVDGLHPNVPIYASGFKVGNVSKRNYDYATGTGIVASIELDKQLRVPKNAMTEIQKDLMGNMKVDLIMPSSFGDALSPGEMIDGKINGGVLSEASEMVPDIVMLMPKIDSIITSLNKILASPALQNTVTNLEGISANLKETTAGTNKLVGTANQSLPELLDKANKILSNADVTMAHAQVLTGNLAEVDVAQTMKMVNTTLERTSQAMSKLNNSMTDINVMTSDINNGTGTIGKLLKDEQLYSNLNKLSVSADSLVVDLKAHPNRSVHFSLFGRKDK